MARFHNTLHKGHMETVLHIFGYIKGHLNLKVVFDLAYCIWMHIGLHDDTEWKDFYSNAAEPMHLLHQNQGQGKCRSISIVMPPMQLAWQHRDPQLVS